MLYDLMLPLPVYEITIAITLDRMGGLWKGRMGGRSWMAGHTASNYRDCLNSYLYHGFPMEKLHIECFSILVVFPCHQRPDIVHCAVSDGNSIGQFK